MDIASRLRQVREWRHLSQGDIEERTGLLRCYISRVENGHTVPSIETLEKLARALGLQMYQLFLDNEAPAGRQKSTSKDKQDWASRGIGERTFHKFRNALAQMSEKDRAVLLFTATKMVGAKQHSK